MSPNPPLEPWHSFLSEIDAFVPDVVCIHCLGGFVIQQLYGLPRPTADVDTLSITPKEEAAKLVEKAGENSALHHKYKVYLDLVTICDPPDSYEDRLTGMFPGVYKKLRLLALDPYDLALTKIQRNYTRDREDVKFLAKKVPFDLTILKDRYEKELRPYLGNQDRHDLTLKLWIDMIEEDRSSA